MGWSQTTYNTPKQHPKFPIRHGFLRAEDGMWVNLSKVTYFTLNADPEGGVYIIAVISEKCELLCFLKDGDYISVAHCPSREEAQELLDVLMGNIY